MTQPTEQEEDNFVRASGGGDKAAVEAFLKQYPQAHGKRCVLNAYDAAFAARHKEIAEIIEKAYMAVPPAQIAQWHEKDFPSLAGLSLKEIFNETAAGAMNDFPDKLHNLYVGNQTGEPIYVSPKAAGMMTKHQKSKVRKLAKRTIYGMSTDFNIGKFFGPREKLTLVCVNDEGGSGYVSNNYPVIMDAIGSLDHELGHQIIEGGFGDAKHLGESIANAYAALRHIQRFGDTTDFFTSCPYRKTRDVIEGQWPDIYYSAAVMQKIDGLRKEIDITALTPRETAERAGEIARDYSFSEKILNRIVDAYDPLKTYVKENIRSFDRNPKYDIGYFHVLIGVMRQHADDPDIYRAGRLVVSYHMEEIKKEVGKDPFWAEALAFMEKHEKDSGIILNLADAIDAQRGIKPRNTSPEAKKKPQI